MTISNIQTIGFVGAGNIGRELSRASLAKGYQVVLSNSRGPETLADLVESLGEGADAASSAGAAAIGDLVVVTVPLKDIGSLPENELEGKIVLDTCNYYPQRDGQIAELDEGRATTSGLVQRQLPQSRVVKAFNHIMAADIPTKGSPAGTPDRRALAIAGDDSQAKAVVASYIDDLGFDVVDLGDLSESWRIERDTPGYVKAMNATELAKAMADAPRLPAA